MHSKKPFKNIPIKYLVTQRLQSIGILLLTGSVMVGCLPPPQQTLRDTPRYSSQVQSPQPPQELSHTVQRGDTLGGIAQQYTGKTANYKALMQHNRIRDARKIRLGQVIRIPGYLLEGQTGSYQVASGGGSMRNETPLRPASGSTDTKRTIMEGAGISAVVGVLLGTACKKKDRSKCMAIGGLIGGGLGAWAGNEVAKRKKGYATDEAFLNAEIQDAKQRNQRLTQYNRTLGQQIRTLESTSRRLRQQYAARQVSYETINQEKAKIRKKVGNNQQIIEDSKKELAVKKKLHEQQMAKANTADVRQLQQQIALLQQNIQKLEASSQQLASIDDRLSV